MKSPRDIERWTSGGRSSRCCSRSIGKPACDDGPAAGAHRDAQIAAVSFDDVVAEGKTEARAARFGRPERQDRSGHRLFAHAFAAIADDEQTAAGSPLN